MAYIKIKVNKTEDEVETVVELDTKGLTAAYEYEAISKMTQDLIKCLVESGRVYYHSAEE